MDAATKALHESVSNRTEFDRILKCMSEIPKMASNIRERLLDPNLHNIIGFNVDNYLDLLSYLPKDRQEPTMSWVKNGLNWKCKKPLTYPSEIPKNNTSILDPRGLHAHAKITIKELDLG